MNQSLEQAVLKALNISPEQHEKDVQQRISEFNLPPSFDYTDMTVDQAKMAKLTEMKWRYKRDLIAGFTTEATGEPIRIKYAEIDQINFTKRSNAVALGTSELTFDFGTADGVKTFTTDEWKVIAKDAESHEMAVYDKLDNARNQVEAATSVDEVKAIKWSE